MSISYIANRPKIAIVGGTHGNEFTGTYLVNHWISSGEISAREGVDIALMIANPKAVGEVKRYIDKDLNRCFKLDDLNDNSLHSEEAIRAKQINQMLGPKGQSKTDFIIDLHTSTANMQTNIVLIKIDDFHLKLAAFLKHLLPNIVITSESQLMSDHHFLCSIADKGVVIEVGPIAQGSLDYSILEQTKNAVEGCLEFVELQLKNSVPHLNDSLTVMSYFEKRFFPLDDNGEIAALIHPDWIGKAYPQIQPGQQLFKKLNGEDILYDGETANLAFINEAAYYDQQIAMCLCHPVTYLLSTGKPSGS